MDWFTQQMCICYLQETFFQVDNIRKLGLSDILPMQAFVVLKCTKKEVENLRWLNKINYLKCYIYSKTSFECKAKNAWLLFFNRITIVSRLNSILCMSAGLFLFQILRKSFCVR